MTRSDNDNRFRPTRAQRLVAFGFLGAFGLTILTVLLTGLWVRAPKVRHGEPPAVEQRDAPERRAVEQLPEADDARDKAQSESLDRASPQPAPTDDRDSGAAPARTRAAPVRTRAAPAH